MKKKTCEDSTLFSGVEYVTYELLWEGWNNEVTVGTIKESLKNYKDEYYIQQTQDWVDSGEYLGESVLQPCFYLVRPATEEEIGEYKKEIEKTQTVAPYKETVADLVTKLNGALKEEGVRGTISVCGKEIGISVTEKLIESQVFTAKTDLNTFAKLDPPQEENKSLLPKEEKIPLEQKYDYMRKLGGAFDMGNVYQEQFNKILKEREKLEKGLKKC
jgi:hypothetical protein